MRFFDFQNIQH